MLIMSVGVSKTKAVLDRHGVKGMERAAVDLSKKSPGFKKQFDKFKNDDKGAVNSTIDMANAIHAADRHDRRHPDNKVMEALNMLASIDYPYNG